MTISTTDGDGIGAVAALVTAAGVGGRRLREAIARLSDGPQHLDDLVRDCALPRRTVEALLRAAEVDLRRSSGGRVALADGAVIAYRKRFGHDELRRTALADPFAGQLSAHHALTTRLAGMIDAAPAANADLDHVSATAETAARRALWLDATYDLAGAHLLCVGDHDLTSLAVAMLRDDCRVSVVDVDDRLLGYLDATAAEHRLRIDCWYADLRFGLPPVLAGSADLIFTDPPYTPPGVQLFLARGLQALRDRGSGRLLLSYGFSPLTPAIGVKVQRAVHDLDLVVEAILPAFNRYQGAQAIGSASDLYVCRPTSRTWQILDRQLAKATVNLYTHGSQSQEGGTTDVGGLSALFDGTPRSASTGVSADLAGDPGSWLLRALLSVNAERVELIVPNHHPDLVDAPSQQALRDLLAPKYRLKLRRSTPSPRLATVEATAVDDDGSVARWLLTHAYGKIGNVLREALIRQNPALRKNEARAQIPARLRHESRLVDLPRRAVLELIKEVRARETGSSRRVLP
jgi:N4-bis(aminopropyl)spermidine synthase